MWHQKNHQTILSPQDWQNQSNFFSSDEKDVEWPKNQPVSSPADGKPARRHTRLSQGHPAMGLQQDVVVLVINSWSFVSIIMTFMVMTLPSPQASLFRAAYNVACAFRVTWSEDMSPNLYWPTRPGKTLHRDLASYNLLHVPHEDKQHSFTDILLRWDQTNPSTCLRYEVRMFGLENLKLSLGQKLKPCQS